MDADAVVSESTPTKPESAATRGLENLEALLRVIRIPRADVAAMLAQLPPETHGLLASTDPVAEALAPFGWLVPDGGPRAVYEAAASTIAALPNPSTQDRDIQAQPEPQAVVDDILSGYWGVSPTRFDGIVDGVRRIYAPTEAAPELGAIRDGRVALIEEALANHEAGRYASAIVIAISQFDGIAADVPPTPGAAFPFLVADARDRESVDPRITGELIASHPGCVTLVSRLMRTGRPDTNTGAGLHRHGIMHGRDLRFGTRANATKVLTTLLALVQWAEPLARARA